MLVSGSLADSASPVSPIRLMCRFVLRARRLVCLLRLVRCIVSSFAPFRPSRRFVRCIVSSYVPFRALYPFVLCAVSSVVPFRFFSLCVEACLRPGPSGRVAGVATAGDFFTLFLRDASEFAGLYHTTLGDRWGDG